MAATVSRALDWVRTSDSSLPRRVRSTRRWVARTQARRSHGSLPAAMAATVAEVRRPPARTVRTRTTAPLRVVEVSTYPLHPCQTGGQLRGYHLARALADEADVEVAVLSATTDPERAGRRQLGEHLTEDTFALPAGFLDRDTELRLVSGPVAITDVSLALMWAAVPDLAAALERELADASAVVLVQPYLGPAVNHLGGGLPVVCDEHNDEWQLKAGLLPASPGGRWLLDRVDEVERTAVESSRLVTATTAADLGTLDRRYRLPDVNAVVPNGVDTTTIEFVAGGDRQRRRLAVNQDLGIPEGRPTVLFVGSGHGPNIDAGRRILHLATRLPDVEFVLAGRHSTALGVRRLPDNVTALGVVGDAQLDLLLAGCDVALNPMDSGSGSNLKLLSYLAAGIPVVSTAVGARGIDAGVAGVRTCELDEMAGAVVEVLAERGSERSEAGREYVEAHCDWRAIGQRFVELTREHVLP